MHVYVCVCTYTCRYVHTAYVDPMNVCMIYIYMGYAYTYVCIAYIRMHAHVESKRQRIAIDDIVPHVGHFWRGMSPAF